MLQLCDLGKVSQLTQLSVSFSVKLSIRELWKFGERKRRDWHSVMAVCLLLTEFHGRTINKIMKVELIIIMRGGIFTMNLVLGQLFSVHFLIGFTGSYQVGRAICLQRNWSTERLGNLLQVAQSKPWGSRMQTTNTLAQKPTCAILSLSIIVPIFFACGK